MKTYIGTKLIKAEPALELTPLHPLVNDPLIQREPREGYKVVYADGYTSWSPKDVFKAAYRELDNLTFGLAVEALKIGKKVARAGWNGKGMFLFLVPGSTFQVNRPPLLGIYEEGTSINYQSHIDMKTAQDTVVPWLASQSDVLAEDWVIVE